jgi:spermidine/putrescine transport system substrate-binding protein
MCWAGDAVTVKERNPNLEYVIPKEGTNLWVDSMVIPKNSEHKKEALLFIDFMNRPEIAQRNAEYVGYATPNKSAYGLLDEETREDPTAYPPDEELARYEVFIDIGPANAEYNRVWTEIKSWAKN